MRKKKLPPWQQPIVFDPPTNGGAITKERYERTTEALGRPLSWRPRSDYIGYGIEVGTSKTILSDGRS